MLEKLVCVCLAHLPPEKAGASWYTLGSWACLQPGLLCSPLPVLISMPPDSALSTSTLLQAAVSSVA